MKVFISLISAVMIFAFVAVSESAVLDFEDLYPGYETTGTLAGNYAGFEWSDTMWITKHYSTSTGYYYGTFGKVSIFSPYADSSYDIIMSSGPGSYFTFNSAYITSALRNSNTVVVEGWRDHVKIYANNVSLPSWSTPIFFNTFYEDIDTLVFNRGSGRIVVDNIDYTVQNAVPEPATMLLLGFGLTGIAGLRRRLGKR